MTSTTTTLPAFPARRVSNLLAMLAPASTTTDTERELVAAELAAELRYYAADLHQYARTLAGPARRPAVEAALIADGAARSAGTGAPFTVTAHRVSLVCRNAARLAA